MFFQATCLCLSNDPIHYGFETPTLWDVVIIGLSLLSQHQELVLSHKIHRWFKVPKSESCPSSCSLATAPLPPRIVPMLSVQSLDLQSIGIFDLPGLWSTIGRLKLPCWWLEGETTIRFRSVLGQPGFIFQSFGLLANLQSDSQDSSGDASDPSLPKFLGGTWWFGFLRRCPDCFVPALLCWLDLAGRQVGTSKCLFCRKRDGWGVDLFKWLRHHRMIIQE